MIQYVQARRFWLPNLGGLVACCFTLPRPVADVIPEAAYADGTKATMWLRSFTEP
jgi:hypothetical protein